MTFKFKKHLDFKNIHSLQEIHFKFIFNFIATLSIKDKKLTAWNINQNKARLAILMKDKVYFTAKKLPEAERDTTL